MERYLGADVHAASVTFSVLSESGKELRHDVVETNGQALVGYLKQIPGQPHLCIEEGEWSQWLTEILSPRVAEMVVVRGEWRPGSKSDRIDARGWAERLRTGQLKGETLAISRAATRSVKATSPDLFPVKRCQVFDYAAPGPENLTAPAGWRGSRGAWSKGGGRGA
jgi:hypothetical protein